MEKNDILKNALLDAKTELNTTYLDGFLIDVADLVFEERVKMNCYYSADIILIGNVRRSCRILIIRRCFRSLIIVR